MVRRTHKEEPPKEVNIIVPSKRHFLAALCGAVVVFLWSLFSMMVLPWHQNNMNKFNNEHQVAHVIRENATMSGIYILPNTFSYNDSTPQHEVENGIGILERGPFMFASIMQNGVGPMSAWPFVIGFLIDFAGALILTWMILMTTGLSFGRIVTFVMLFGLSIGIISQLPDWNWWGFPFVYVFISMMDILIGWTLAGYAIAYFIRKKK